MLLLTHIGSVRASTPYGVTSEKQLKTLANVIFLRSCMTIILFLAVTACLCSKLSLEYNSSKITQRFSIMSLQISTVKNIF